MLEVQKYLASGKTLDDLTAELGIVAKRHDTLPLVILNYDQIESPKTHPIVRECRALVLNSTTYGLVAKSFNRFFNWGEVADEMGRFDFSNFCVQSKEDGSLVVIYHFDGQWRLNTRGSFATDNMQHQDFSWQEGFFRALGVTNVADLNNKALNANYTYIAEFCSPWNKIVRRYDKPKMYLLTMFEGLQELDWNEVDRWAYMAGGMFDRPTRYQFTSIDEIQTFLQQQASADPTFEGVVIADTNGNRWKIKSATYLGLHKLRGEGDNVFNPKHLLPFVLAGEEDELLTYFPEVTEAFFRLKADVQSRYAELLEVWADNKDIEAQKDFALAIKDQTPFTGILFDVRKRFGNQQRSANVRKVWRESESAILKHLKC